MCTVRFSAIITRGGDDLDRFLLEMGVTPSMIAGRLRSRCGDVDVEAMEAVDDAACSSRKFSTVSAIRGLVGFELFSRF